MSKEYDISVCLGSSCYSRNNKAALEVIKSFIQKNHLNANVFFHGDLCSGNCQNGPIIKIEDQLYDHITPEAVELILNEFFKEELMD